jgi:large subunit ribosomal protein L10
MAHVSDSKKKVVKEFIRLVKDYSTVGAIDLEGMPTSQLQKMRATLRDNDIVLLVSKRRLMKIALDQSTEAKKGIEQLKEHLKGMPALIFSKKDSFKLFKLLKQSKSEAPAKAGQEAPKDIVVKAGKTNFLPGPIISELANVGIKSGVDDGKVAIKEDAVVAKMGDTISPELAGILTRLDIKPMEIGLNLTATFEEGVIFQREVLDVDEEQIINNITKAAQESFNLSVEAGYFTKDNVNVIIQKVFSECKALAEESGFLADLVVEDMLASAERSAKSLQSEAKVEVVEKKEEAPKEEEKKEVEEKLVETPQELSETQNVSDDAQKSSISDKKEEKALEKATEAIKEEKKLEEPVKEEQAPVEKEVKEAVKEEEEKELEKERIDAEKEVEKIEEEKKEEVAEEKTEEVKEEVKPVEPEQTQAQEQSKEEPSTDDKIAKMVEAQKKHASGEDKKESAEALIEEVTKEDKEKKEIEEVENLVAQLKKGEPLKPKSDDEVPSLNDLAKRKK